MKMNALAAGPLDQHVPEKALQAQVESYARMNGWLCYHTYDSRRSEPGFPDLIAIRGNRLVVAELKTQNGRVSKPQKKWLDAWREVPNAEVHVWRPSDWTRIIEVLRR